MDDFGLRLQREIPRLRRYAYALARNKVRVDDLVQDTLARAIDKAHLWQPGTNLRAWLFAIMHNQNASAVMRAVRDQASVDLDACPRPLVATSDPTAARQLRELECALGELPEEQRQVILLVGLEGMSYDEAAAILNVPVGTVRSRLSRGRGALRRAMSIGSEGATSAAERYLEPTLLAA